jgi:hypothetical protein
VEEGGLRGGVVLEVDSGQLAGELEDRGRWYTRASLPWKVSISTVSPLSAAIPARNGTASSSG